MNLQLQNNYQEFSDKEIVDKIITLPYNEEAAAYLIYNKYNPLLGKIYRKIYDGDNSWYEDCLGDLFDYLRGKDQNWNKLRSFEWRCLFVSWLGKTANNRFLEIKPYLIGKIKNPLYIDSDDENHQIQLPEGGDEEYERQQMRILVLEAISMLIDNDHKFVLLKRLQGYNSKEIAVLMKQSWIKHGVTKLDKHGKVVIPTPGYIDVKTQRAKEKLKEIISKLTK